MMIATPNLWNPLVSPPLILGCAVAALALLIVTRTRNLRRRHGELRSRGKHRGGHSRGRGRAHTATALQALAWLIVLGLLLQPGVARTDPPEDAAGGAAARGSHQSAHNHPTDGRPLLIVLEDRSASMDTRDVRLPASALAGNDTATNPLTSRSDYVEQVWFGDKTAVWDALRTGTDLRFATLDSSGSTVEVYPTFRQPTEEAAVALASSTDAPTAPVAPAGTAILRALENISEQGAADAVLLLTDGRDTTTRSVGDAAASLRAAGTRVFPAVLGSSRRSPNRAVRVAVAGDPGNLIAGEPVRLHVQVLREAEIDPSASARVQIRLDDVLIAEATPPPGVGELIFTIRPELPVSSTIDPEPDPAAPVAPEAESEADGAIARASPDADGGMLDEAVLACSVNVQSAEGETHFADNEEHLLLVVRRPRIRVVVLENEPYWDTRYLVDALRRDPKIDLTTVMGLGAAVHVTRYPSISDGDGNDGPATAAVVASADTDAEAAGETLDDEASSQAIREALADADVIILGRGAGRWIDGPDQVADFERQLLTGDIALLLARGLPEVTVDSALACTANEPSSESTALTTSESGPRSFEAWLAARAPVTLTGRTVLTRSGVAFAGIDTLPQPLAAFAEYTALARMQTRVQVGDPSPGAAVWAEVRWPEPDNNRAALSPPVDRTAGNPAERLPAIVYGPLRHTSRGRMLVVLFDDHWRWARPQSASTTSIAPIPGDHALFWRSAVRWLARESDSNPLHTGDRPGLAVEPSPVRIGGQIGINLIWPGTSSAPISPPHPEGQPALRSVTPEVVIRDPSGRLTRIPMAPFADGPAVSPADAHDEARLPSEVEPAPAADPFIANSAVDAGPHTWRGTYVPSVPGVHSVRALPPRNASPTSSPSPFAGMRLETKFIAIAVDPEQRNLAADFDSMARLARLTGGAMIPADDPAAFLQALAASGLVMLEPGGIRPAASDPGLSFIPGGDDPEGFRPLLPLSPWLLLLVLALLFGGWWLDPIDEAAGGRRA